MPKFEGNSQMRPRVRGVFGASGHGRDTMAWLAVTASPSV